ncbi:MAG: tRNA-dihydrouridine synthase [Parcubacteria group bacterium GW2011_GWF1_40_5]|nr:MAG: tRNA-dihydrouridine synthase [Parcubacteria group bacterium GW2011_GWF1_40_5]
MSKGFWKKLKKPILVMAPMANVTDMIFRQIVASCAKPDVFWTEFVSADGLCSAGREKLLVDFIYSENERPMVAQIFGSKPENIKKASELCRELGFDGVDINMGCPDKSIEKQCAGAAMMKNPQLAREIIRAAKEGAGDLPVSVKTRIGYNKNEIETWIRELLSEDIAALTVHLRTRKEMSNVPAHWDLMKRIVQIRNEMKKKTLILGNGDVLNLEDAKRKVEETGCDGVMLGKAIFGNPWLFAEKVPSIKEKLEVMIEHTKLFEKMLSGHKNFAIMKKHYKAYVNGFDGARELRVKLMEAENALQVENIANDFLGKIE